MDVERGTVLEPLGWITKESRVTWAPLRMCHILLSCSLHLSDGYLLLHAGGLLLWGLTISQLTVPSGKCHWDLLHHPLSVQSLRVLRQYQKHVWGLVLPQSILVIFCQCGLLHLLSRVHSCTIADVFLYIIFVCVLDCMLALHKHEIFTSM